MYIYILYMYKYINIYIYIYIYANKSETILKWVLNRPYQTKFLIIEMRGLSHTTSNNGKLLHPSEIKKPVVMIENIMEILENTFLIPFRDKLDASKLYNIVSDQPIDDSLKDSLLSLEEAGKQLMSEYIERMNRETYSESTMVDKIEQYKMKNFTASNLSFKVKWNKKMTEI